MNVEESESYSYFKSGLRLQQNGKIFLTPNKGALLILFKDEVERVLDEKHMYVSDLLWYNQQ